MKSMIKYAFLLTAFLAWSKVAIPQEQSKLLYEKAKKEYNDGNFEATIALSKQISSLIGNTNPRLQSLLVQSYYRINDFVNAKIELNKYKKVIPAGYTSEAHTQLLSLEPEIDKGVEAMQNNFQKYAVEKRITDANALIIETRNEHNKKITLLTPPNDPVPYFTIKDRKDLAKSNANLKQLVDKNFKYGVYNKPSKTIIIQPKYDAMHKFKENVAWVKLNNKWGLINTNGELLINYIYDEVQDFNEFRACVKKNNKWGFVNLQGKVVIDFLFDKPSMVSEGLIAVSVKDTFGFIDYQGVPIIPTQFENAEAFANGLALVQISGKYGYINQTGTFEIGPKFKNAESFSEGLAAVKIDDKYGFINKKGEVTIKPVYDYVSSFKNGSSIVEIDGKYAVIDNIGKYLKEPVLEYLMVNEGKFIERNEKGITYFVDSKYNKVFPDKAFLDARGFAEGYAPIKLSSGWGFLDDQGEITIPLKYNFVRSFNDGIATIVSEDKFGLINILNEIIIEPKYDDIELNPFVVELCGVKVGEEWGFINKKGDIVIKPQFKEVRSFVNNYAVVTSKENKEGLIDPLGNLILPFDYNFIDSHFQNPNKIGVMKNDVFLFINIKGEVVEIPK